MGRPWPRTQVGRCRLGWRLLRVRKLRRGSPTLRSSQIQRARGENLLERYEPVAQALLVDVLRNGLEHGTCSLHAVRHGIADERARHLVAERSDREERSEVRL